MRAALISILVLAAVVVGGGLVATVAYQAGVNANVVTVPATTDGATAVTPVVVAPYAYGWGFHGPFPWFFGFFAFLFFLFLVFGIIRALTWRGRGGYGGRGGPGYWGDPDHDHRRQRFEEWHRSAHGEPPASNPPAAPPAG